MLTKYAGIPFSLQAAIRSYFHNRTAAMATVPIAIGIKYYAMLQNVTKNKTF